MTSDNYQHLLLVFAAYVVAAGSPGPSSMRIMATAMSRGRPAALLLAAGVVTGSVFWGTMAATGLAAILARYASVLVVLKVLGGLYLLYLAYKAGRSALSNHAVAATAAVEAREASAGAFYRAGLLIHLSNPKSILGWIAIVTIGIGPNAAPGTVFVILAGCAVLSVIIFGGYALLFSTAPMVNAYRRTRRWLDGLLAVCFAYAGVRLLQWQT